MNHPIRKRILSTAAVVTVFLSTMRLLSADTPPVIVLWPNGAPGSESRRDVPEVESKGSLTQVHNPSLTVFLPDKEKATGTGVVVLAGGGHRFLTIQSEGYSVAKSLAEHGIAAFVLKYRLAREAGSLYHVDNEPVRDTERALRLVRSRAQEWGIDPAKIGVMGFSAGGELASAVCMKNDEGDKTSVDPIERETDRPAFEGLIYPGQSQNIQPVKGAPPAFLACGNNDRTDISEGLPQVYLRFKQAGVPVELHIYAGAGHGFGIKPGPQSEWIVRFCQWIFEQTGRK